MPPRFPPSRLPLLPSLSLPLLPLSPLRLVLPLPPCSALHQLPLAGCSAERGAVPEPATAHLPLEPPCRNPSVA
jgi:hypothetical protein